MRSQDENSTMVETCMAETCMAEACSVLLEQIGENPEREGLLKTPMRFQESMGELTSGYNQTAKEIVGDALFAEAHSEMVVVRDIEYYSLCEHHLLPFFGKMHIAYVPNGKIIGISKIPRIVQMFARRLQVQERLTGQIADTLYEVLNPHGVACAVEGRHMCMMMRGVQTQSSSVTTTAFRGSFLKDEQLRSEFHQIT